MYWRIVYNSHFLLKHTSTGFHQTVVMTAHNNDIAHLANRIIRIEDGKIVD